MMAQEQVGHHGIMIRPGQWELAALEDIESLVCQDVVYPQCRGNIDICPAYTESFLQESVLPATPDGKIGIEIGNIVKVPANHSRIRAFIQLRSYFLRLVPPMPEGSPQF